MKKRTLLGLLALVPTLWLAGCGGGSSSGDAQVRLVNASAGYASLDLILNDSSNDASVAGTISAVAYGKASSYETVRSGTTYTNLTVSGSNTYVLSQSRSFSKDHSYTVVAFGNEGALKSLSYADNLAAADSGKTKFSVLNGAYEAGSLDIYLTAASDDLAAFTPVASSIAAGAQSGYSSITSGTYRLRATATGSKTDVRLDVPSVTLSSTDVVTFVATDTAGGFLVNGVQISQGGAVTNVANTKARVRAVVGNAGTSTTVSVGGTALLTDSPSQRISLYSIVTAGSTSIAGTVDGTAMTTISPTIAAGTDVTVMAVTTVAGNVLKTVTDDNRLLSSSSGNVKLRLVNAMSGTGTDGNPLNLSLGLNLSPVASAIQPGVASAYSEDFAATTSGTLTVAASNFGHLFSTSADQVLTARGVYSVFMFGTSADPVFQLYSERLAP